MQRAILVLSKNASLVEIIRSNLEEGGRYYVQGVTSVHSTLAMVRHRSFDLAILDLEQADPSAAQLIHNLKAIQPEIKILVYDHNDPDLLENLQTVSVDGFLARPFFAPELSDRLRSLFNPADPTRTPKNMPEIEPAGTDIFLQDPESDFAELSSLLEHTSAGAAMIFVNGKTTSKTSSMSPVIAQKISEMISSVWPNYKGCDFCRYLKAEDGVDASLVYSLPVTPEVVLAFTYPAGSDLRLIRQETIHLRDAFMINRFSSQRVGISASQQPPVEDHEFQRVADSYMEDLDSTHLPVPEENESQWVLELDETVPEPLPPAMEKVFSAPIGVISEQTGEVTLADTQPIRTRAELLDGESTRPVAAPVEHASLPMSPAAPDQNAPNLPEQAQAAGLLDTSITLPWEEGASKSSSSNTASSAENVLSSVMAAQDAILRDLPAAPKKPCTLYHCVIIPQSPRHFLTRELGEHTAAILRRHHQMNGWELSHMTIRPQYAMWTVNLPVSVDPVKLVEDIKDETTEMLLTLNPAENSLSEGESFWAAGYWILSGQHPPSGSLIKQFLNFNKLNSQDSKKLPVDTPGD